MKIKIPVSFRHGRSLLFWSLFLVAMVESVLAQQGNGDAYPPGYPPTPQSWQINQQSDSSAYPPNMPQYPMQPLNPQKYPQNSPRSLTVSNVMMSESIKMLESSGIRTAAHPNKLLDPVPPSSPATVLPTFPALMPTSFPEQPSLPFPEPVPSSFLGPVPPAFPGSVPPIYQAIPREEWEMPVFYETKFGQFSPRTDAERELEKMLHGKDEDIDLALANWLIVADIPQFSDLTRDEFFLRLDIVTKQVRQYMEQMQKSGWHGTNPNDPDTRFTRFCSAIFKQRFSYCEKFRQFDLTPEQTKALYADANNIFLAGLLRTRQGSCVSMPMIHIVIGQILGVPVHLVTLGKHYFARWEEPGYRMNIEATISSTIAVTSDDSVYLDTEGFTRDQLTGTQLRNLTNREVVGELFFLRAAHWSMMDGKFENQHCIDLSRARHLSPDDPGIKRTHQAVFNHYGIKPQHKTIDIRITSNKNKEKIEHEYTNLIGRISGSGTFSRAGSIASTQYGCCHRPLSNDGLV